jgi:LPXTG-site transpeptidase (sortase) family protein
MEQEARAATDRIASAVASSRQEYRTIPYAVWVVTRKGRNLLREFTRFASTFAVIFSILFVSLNYQSFWQILSPYLRPEEERARSLALQRIVDPSLSQKLQRIPSLTTAGADMAALPLLDLSVLPPDTRLVIPKIGKNVPITHPSSNALEREDWKAFDEEIQRELKNGVVHYPGTARPGQRGNAFFTGHSSYYPWDSGRYKDVFARLPELVVGDVYVIYDHGRAHHYRVTNVFEVMPDDASVLDQPFNRQMSTLMTCVPIGTTLRRLIVQGEEFDPLTGELILSDIYAVDERLPTPEVLLPI